MFANSLQRRTSTGPGTLPCPVSAGLFNHLVDRILSLSCFPFLGGARRPCKANIQFAGQEYCLSCWQTFQQDQRADVRPYLMPMYEDEYQQHRRHHECLCHLQRFITRMEY